MACQGAEDINQVLAKTDVLAFSEVRIDGSPADKLSRVDQAPRIGLITFSMPSIVISPL